MALTAPANRRDKSTTYLKSFQGWSPDAHGALQTHSQLPILHLNWTTTGRYYLLDTHASLLYPSTNQRCMVLMSPENHLPATRKFTTAKTILNKLNWQLKLVFLTRSYNTTEEFHPIRFSLWFTLSGIIFWHVPFLVVGSGGLDHILVTMLQSVFRIRVRQAVWHDARTGTWSWDNLVFDLQISRSLQTQSIKCLNWRVWISTIAVSCW